MLNNKFKRDEKKNVEYVNENEVINTVKWIERKSEIEINKKKIPQNMYFMLYFSTLFSSAEMLSCIVVSVYLRACHCYI